MGPDIQMRVAATTGSCIFLAWGDKPEKLARQETCAVRQDAFSKVHENFVTAKEDFHLHEKPFARTVLIEAGESIGRVDMA